MPQELTGLSLEIGIALVAVLLACVAIAVSILAYGLARKSEVATRSNERANLRISASESFTETKRSLNTLISNCRQSKLKWDNYEQKHLPKLRNPMNDPFEGDENYYSVERAGYNIFEKIRRSFSGVENFNPAEIEQFIHDAKAATAEIGGLHVDLKEPPQMFN